MEGWRQRRRGLKPKTLITKNEEQNILDSHRPSHGRTWPRGWTRVCLFNAEGRAAASIHKLPPSTDGPSCIRRPEHRGCYHGGNPRFDLFSGLPDRNAIWIEAIHGLANAVAAHAFNWRAMNALTISCARSVSGPGLATHSCTAPSKIWNWMSPPAAL